MKGQFINVLPSPAFSTLLTSAFLFQFENRDMIQISQETANLLIEAGKERWVKPRDKKIMAKGECFNDSQNSTCYSKF